MDNQAAPFTQPDCVALKGRAQGRMRRNGAAVCSFLAFVPAVFFFWICGGIVPGYAQTTPGVTSNTILIGQIGPLSASPAATALFDGVESYWKSAELVHGRRVVLQSRDDGGSPGKAVEESRRLIETEKVFALFNIYGTPANLAIRKYANDSKVPQLFVGSASGQIDEPLRFPWTMGWQPPFEVEAIAFLRDIAAKNPSAIVGLLTGDSDFNRRYEDFVVNYSRSLPIKILPFRVAADSNVPSTIANLKNSAAKVLLTNIPDSLLPPMFATVRQLGWSVTTYIARQGPYPGPGLDRLLTGASGSVVTSAFLKDPRSAEYSNDGDVREWLSWMSSAGRRASDLDWAYVYAYAVSATLRHVLVESGVQPTREIVMAKAAQMKGVRTSLLIPGIALNTDPRDYVPIRSVALQSFNDGRWRTLAIMSTGGGGCTEGQRCSDGVCRVTCRSVQ